MSQAYEELEKLLEHQNALKEQINRQCKLLVDMVLDGTITDAQEVNKILETVTYLCDGKRYLELDRVLCRHIVTHYPQFRSTYPNMFRARYE